MTTILHVRFRRDARADGGQLVPAFSEDLDLDALTPRARALAEALHDSMQPGTLRSLEVVQESEQTRRESMTPQQWAVYGDPTRADEKTTRTVLYRFPKSTDARTTAQWLEEQARDIPLDWYPIGAVHRPRVPSWEAGRDDRYLSRDAALAYLRERGAPISPKGWDTLRGTDVLRPDRYVLGYPQWRPETIEAFASRDRELWTADRVAKELGLANSNNAGGQLRRWGIPAEGREPGRTGQNLYPADLVKAAHAHRPGRGHRTDLKDQPQF